MRRDDRQTEKQPPVPTGGVLGIVVSDVCMSVIFMRIHSGRSRPSRLAYPRGQDILFTQYGIQSVSDP